MLKSSIVAPHSPDGRLRKRGVDAVESCVSGRTGRLFGSFAAGQPFARQPGLQFRIDAPGDEILSHGASMTPPDKAGQSYKISSSCAVFLMTPPKRERWPLRRQKRPAPDEG